VEAVTKSVNLIELDEINYIDTPGFNDPNKQRSDNQIFTDIIEKVGEIIKSDGIASILQCIMIPESGRINASAFKLMSKMLQAFTLSYPKR